MTYDNKENRILIWMKWIGIEAKRKFDGGFFSRFLSKYFSPQLTFSFDFGLFPSIDRLIGPPYQTILIK